MWERARKSEQIEQQTIQIFGGLGVIWNNEKRTIEQPG